MSAAAQLAENLALKEMEIVLVEVGLCPTIIDVKEHSMGNRCLILYLRLLINQAVTDLTLCIDC
jgi:hypothetical protein